MCIRDRAEPDTQRSGGVQPHPGRRGGIRDGKTARLAAEAGADWIITGNLAEEFDDADELQRTLTQFIVEMNGG